MFFGTLTLIPSGHQTSIFFLHGIELPNIINDFISMSNNFGSIDIIAIDELACVVPNPFNLVNRIFVSHE
jgi:hypothetical protein